MNPVNPVNEEIEKIFNDNKLNDLKKFINKRSWLNCTNMVLGYSFHVVQSAGVLTTTIAAGYNMKELVWIGVGMNILASLINVFEKMNASMSKSIMKDIIAIKNGSYVDEGMMNDGEKSGEGNAKSQKETGQSSSGTGQSASGTGQSASGTGQSASVIEDLEKGLNNRPVNKTLNILAGK